MSKIRHWLWPGVITAAIWGAGIWGYSKIAFGEQMGMSPNSMMMQSSTVGNLPTCNASLQGQIMLVTDGLLPTFLVAVAAGGAVKVPVVCNGAGWIVF